MNPTPPPTTPLFKELERLPRSLSTHLWADYVELRALTSSDKLFSRGYLQDIFELAADVNRDAEESDDDIEPNQSTATGEGEDASSNRSTDRKFDRRWQAVKVALNSRSRRLGEAWPFVFENDVIKLAHDSDSGLHHLYLTLLLSSSLRYVHKNRTQEIADKLEEIGLTVFEAMMPPQWNVESFGKNTTTYSGTKAQKLKTLAERIQAQVVFRDSQIKPSDSGDAGLDIVAWHSFNDQLGQIPIAFAQCGCSTTDIDHKQFEPTPSSFNRWLKPDHPATAYYIAPLDYRQNNGEWESRPGEVVLIDRTRIMRVSSAYNLAFATPAFLNEALQFSEPVAA